MTAKKIKQATVAEPTTTGNLSKLPFIFFVWTSFKEEILDTGESSLHKAKWLTYVYMSFSKQNRNGFKLFSFIILS